MPGTESYIELGGLHARWLGSGAPGAEPSWAVFHGFTGTGEDWRSPWPADLPALAIDLPGHGRSRDPAGGFRDEIQALLEALPVAIDRLAGYSLGGRVALALLQAAPRRFQALTILSAHPGLDDATRRGARRVADQRWIALLRDQGIAAFADAWQAQPLFASQSRLPARVLAAQRARRLAQRPEGLARCLASLGLAQMPSCWGALAGMRGTLRWVVGAEDVRFLAIGRRVAALRPGTELLVLPGSGHNPLLERPRVLRRWLGSALGGDGRALGDEASE